MLRPVPSAITLVLALPTVRGAPPPPVPGAEHIVIQRQAGV
jgi:hypothetical protein